MTVIAQKWSKLEGEEVGSEGRNTRRRKEYHYYCLEFQYMMRTLCFVVLLFRSNTTVVAGAARHYSFILGDNRPVVSSIDQTGTTL